MLRWLFTCLMALHLAVSSSPAHAVPAKDNGEWNGTHHQMAGDVYSAYLDTNGPRSLLTPYESFEADSCQSVSASTCEGRYQKKIEREFGIFMFLLTAAVPPAALVDGVGSCVGSGGDVGTCVVAAVDVFVPGKIPSVGRHATKANADDLADIRARYGLTDANTVAAGRTDIPGLENQTFEGLSPALRREAGLGSLDDLHGVDRPIRSPNPNPIASRHAEEDIFNGLARQIDDAGLTAAQLDGRTVNIHISNAGGVCNTCYQGLGTSTATPGVIRQFSERYPTLNIRITAEGGTVRPNVDSIVVRGGQIVD